jgi:hypothetical protein
MRLLHTREVYKYTKYAHVIYKPPKTKTGATEETQRGYRLRTVKKSTEACKGAPKRAGGCDERGHTVFIMGGCVASV